MVARLGLALMITGMALYLGALQLLAPQARVAPRRWPREVFTAFLISAVVMLLGIIVFITGLVAR